MEDGIAIVVTEEFEDGTPREAFMFDVDRKVTDWARVVPLSVTPAPPVGSPVFFPYRVHLCLN